MDEPKPAAATGSGVALSELSAFVLSLREALLGLPAPGASPTELEPELRRLRALAERLGTVEAQAESAAKTLDARAAAFAAQALPKLEERLKSGGLTGVFDFRALLADLQKSLLSAPGLGAMPETFLARESARLQAEVVRLLEEKRRSDSEAAAMRERSRELEARVHRLEKEAEAHQAELERAAGKAQESARDAARRERTEIDADWRKGQEGKEAQRKESGLWFSGLTAWTEAREGLERELSDLRREVSSKTEELGRLREALTRSTAAASASEDARVALEERTQALEADLRRWREDAGLARAAELREGVRSAARQGEIEARVLDEARLEARLEETCRELAALEEAFGRLERERETLARFKRDAEFQLLKADDDAAASATARRRLESELEGLGKTAAELQKKLKAAEKAWRDAEGRAGRSETLSAEQAAELTRLGRAAAELAEKLHATGLRASEAELAAQKENAANADLTTRLEASTAEAQEQGERARALDARLDETTREAARLDGLLKAADQARRALEGGLAEALERSRAFQERLASAQTRLAEAEADRGRLGLETADAKRRITELEARGAELRRKFEQTLAESAQLRARADQAEDLRARLERLHQDHEALARDAEGESARQEAALKAAQTHARELEFELQTLAARKGAARPPGLAPQAEDASEMGPGLALLLSRLTAAQADLKRIATQTAGASRAPLAQVLARLAVPVDGLKLVAEFYSAPPPATPQSPAALIDPVVRSWEAAFGQRGVIIVRKIAHGGPKCMLHPERFRIAAHQLLRNAYQAMPRGGSLTVELTAAEGGRVRLRFIDKGRGFPAAVLQAGPEPFRNASAGGLGLGLALARRIVESFGGSLAVSNGEHGGARVELSLPVAEPGAPRLVPG